MFYCYLKVENDATSFSLSTKADIPPLCCHTSLCFSVKTPACWSINISEKKDDHTKYIYYRRQEKTREGCLNLLSRAFVDKHAAFKPRKFIQLQGHNFTSDSLLCMGKNCCFKLEKVQVSIPGWVGALLCCGCLFSMCMEGSLRVPQVPPLAFARDLEISLIGDSILYRCESESACLSLHVNSVMN